MIRPTLNTTETIFTYKCVDCGTKNKTTTPPEDNMLACLRCGFPTVQVCVSMKKQIKR